MSINNLNTYLNVRDAHLRVVSGNVYAQAMNIGGINVETAHGLQSVSNTGNATSLTLEFANVTTGFVTTANAQIGRDLVVTGNATVSTDLTVSANATVTDTLTVSEHLLASKEATITGNLNVTTIMSDSNVVAEYTGPHDRPLRKYPEVALTADATNANGVLPSASGYKGYKVSASSTYDTGPSYPAWKAFNGVWHNNGNTNGSDVWMSTGSAYGGTDGVYNKSPPQNLGTGANNGEWIKVELPRKIKLNYIKIYPRYQHSSKAPEDFVVYGSNDNINWSAVLTKTGASITS